MKKYEIVKKHDDFNMIMNNNQKFSNSNYTIFKKSNDKNNKLFGIAVSKKTGNAVTRNKLKRQVRMIITKNKRLFKSGFSYIILVKKNCLNISFQEMEESMIYLIERINKL